MTKFFDHRSYMHTTSAVVKSKPEWDSNTGHDLWDSGAVLNQISNQANWEVVTNLWVRNTPVDGKENNYEERYEHDDWSSQLYEYNFSSCEKNCLLYKHQWNTRIFPFTKKSYLHRAQWRYYFYLSRVRILVSPWMLKDHHCYGYIIPQRVLRCVTL